jgi:hypothetical protein
MSTAHADEKTLFLKDFSAPTACRKATFAMVKHGARDPAPRLDTSPFQQLDRRCWREDTKNAYRLTDTSRGCSGAKIEGDSRMLKSLRAVA